MPYGILLIIDIFIAKGCEAKGSRRLTEASHPYRKHDFLTKYILMINNSSLSKWERLDSKQLNSQFQSEIIKGLNCSPFEARAILDVVHKVYGDLFNMSPSRIRPTNPIFPGSGLVRRFGA